MNWKEKRKSLSGGDFPQFSKTVDIHLEIKEMEDGKLAFSYYDSTAKQREFVKGSIKGVLIGQAMRLYVFDSANERSVQSTLFFSYNDNGMLFSGGKKVSSGNMKALKDELSQIGTVKVRRVYYVYTTGGRLVEITTNIGTSIEDINRAKGGFLDKYITLTPTQFSFDDPDYPTKFKNDLGKLAKKNPPRFAKLTLGEEISEDIGEASSVHFDEFNKLKDFISRATKEAVDSVEHEEEKQALSFNAAFDDKKEESTDDFTKRVNAAVGIGNPFAIEDSSDLPF